MYDALWRHHLLFQDNWWFCFFSWILLLQQFNTGTITAQSIADVFIKLRSRVAFMWRLKMRNGIIFDTVVQPVRWLAFMIAQRGVMSGSHVSLLRLVPASSAVHGAKA